MAEKLWLVSLGAQENEIKKYCFAECGQILIGGIDLMGGVFIPCKTASCPHLEDELDLGGFILPHEGERDLVVRKLTEVKCMGNQIYATEAEGTGGRTVR